NRVPLGLHRGRPRSPATIAPRPSVSGPRSLRHTNQKAAAEAAAIGPKRSRGLALTLLVLDDAEADALRIVEDSEAHAHRRLRRNEWLGAQRYGLVEGRVHVLYVEVDLPVAGHMLGHHGVHLPGAEDAF